jgi:serine/threonine-protein kinase
VQYAHGQEIIHRDLKPSNILVEPDGTPRLLDFGVARELQISDELADQTRPGLRFMSRDYAAPEWVRDGSVGFHTDVYSLGVILYQMLTGRPPFTDDDAVVVMARHIKTVPRPMTEVAPAAHIPPEIEATVMRALSKEPEGRPETAEAMAAELTRAFESSTLHSVSSGVRISLRGDERPIVDPVAGPVPASPARTATPSDAPLATDDIRALRPRRGRLLAGIALIAIGAALAYMLGLSGRDLGTASPASSVGSLPAVPLATHPDESSPSAAAITSTASPSPGPSAPHMAASAAVSPPSATARAAASAVRHAAGRGGNPPKAPTAPSVGYGYLE